jgi:hypothetical protein
MGTPFVLDASLTMSWCFPDEATPYSRGVLASLEKPTPWFPHFGPSK